MYGMLQNGNCESKSTVGIYNDNAIIQLTPYTAEM